MCGSIIFLLHPSFREGDVFDDLLDLIYGKTDKISAYRDLFFGFLSGFPLYLTEEKILRSLMFHLLSNRSKVTRGLSDGTFNLEFSRVYFICEVIKKYKIEIRSIYSSEEVGKLDEIVFAATMYFLSQLIKHPI